MFDAGWGPGSRMAETAAAGAGRMAPVLDKDHLAAQTMGDPDLAREVMALFLDQSADVLRAVRETADPVARAEAAHLLKGSARAIGAARVAACAERVERLPAHAAEGEVLAAIADLHASVAEARAAIAAELDGNARGL